VCGNLANCYRLHLLLWWTTVSWQFYGTVGGKTHQLGEGGSSVQPGESSLLPAMSVGKSVVINYLMNSSEHTQPSTVGKFI